VGQLPVHCLLPTGEAGIPLRPFRVDVALGAFNKDCRASEILCDLGGAVKNQADFLQWGLVSLGAVSISSLRAITINESGYVIQERVYK
jgi:hypothetical protein